MKEKTMKELFDAKVQRMRLEQVAQQLKQDVESAYLGMQNQSVAMNQYAHQQALANQAISGTGIYSNQAGAIQTSGVYKESSFDPNKQPAYQMELSALCDLWSAKHGDKWVRNVLNGDDPFWTDAVDRLGSAGMLESTRGWMRLKV